MSVGQKQGSAGDRGGAGRQPMWRSWTEDPRQVRLMNWLTTPPAARQPATRAELAMEIGVSLRTLAMWLNRPHFREGWQAQTEHVFGDPERVQHVLTELYKAAVDPNNRQQVQAAKLYLEATKAIQPQALKVEVKPKELSDEEIDALLAEDEAIAAASRHLAVLPQPDEVTPHSWPPAPPTDLDG